MKHFKVTFRPTYGVPTTSSVVKAFTREIAMAIVEANDSYFDDFHIISCNEIKQRYEDRIR